MNYPSISCLAAFGFTLLAGCTSQTSATVPPHPAADSVEAGTDRKDTTVIHAATDEPLLGGFVSAHNNSKLPVKISGVQYVTLNGETKPCNNTWDLNPGETLTLKDGDDFLTVRAFAYQVALKTGELNQKVHQAQMDKQRQVTIDVTDSMLPERVKRRTGPVCFRNDAGISTITIDTIEWYDEFGESTIIHGDWAIPSKQEIQLLHGGKPITASRFTARCSYFNWDYKPKIDQTWINDHGECMFVFDKETRKQWSDAATNFELYRGR